MYRVLYRKWRPQIFDDVVGQPQVTKTLQTQVRENRLSHAYLFTGSRGTGKTSCAKILSKAVNCLQPVNGNPCNECEICRGINDGTALDIVEIDAASNRGIDDIRLLRDEANFTPAKAKYRVYIIDEVHMLTIEAFNALLKTLEEPPEHVKFILATTEVHKLPSTILSRCQRFDFRRIEPAVIADRLQFVAEKENAVLRRDAALLIARLADGGMRDALSLLDRALSADGEITVDVVSACAGLMGREYIYKLLNAIAARDTALSLTVLDELHKMSCDTERLCVELINQFRNFLILKTVAHPENLIVCSDAELRELKALSDRFTNDETLYALNVLTAAAEAIKRTQNRRIEVEMAVIRLCTPSADQNADALAARVSALEKELAALKAGGFAPAAAPVAVSRQETPIKETPVPAEEPLPFDAPSVPEEEAPPFDAPPVPEEEAPPFDAPPVPEEEALPFDAPPVSEEEAPPFDEPLPGQAAFAGFAQEAAPAGGFADRFDEEDAGDDEAFDFDSFMEKYGTVEKDGKLEKAAAAPRTAESLDERTWVRIILDTERSFRPMIGLLTNSSAEIRGEALVIRPADPRVRFMLREDTLNRYLAPVAAKILGREYKVRLAEQ